MCHVSVSERERECVCVCMWCVCVRERERARERESVCERERETASEVSPCVREERDFELITAADARQVPNVAPPVKKKYLFLHYPHPTLQIWLRNAQCVANICFDIHLLRCPVLSLSTRKQATACMERITKNRLLAFREIYRSACSSQSRWDCPTTWLKPHGSLK